MADFSRTPSIAETAVNTGADGSAREISANKTSYWRQMLQSYEKRNASLERRRSELVERVRFMECTLPSLLMSVATSTACAKRGVHDKQAKASDSTSKSAAQKA